MTCVNDGFIPGVTYGFLNAGSSGLRFMCVSCVRTTALINDTYSNVLFIVTAAPLSAVTRGRGSIIELILFPQHYERLL